MTVIFCHSTIFFLLAFRSPPAFTIYRFDIFVFNVVASLAVWAYNDFVVSSDDDFFVAVDAAVKFVPGKKLEFADDSVSFNFNIIRRFAVFACHSGSMTEKNGFATDTFKVE